MISITDGQIVLNADLFNKGQKPAIEIGRSVSRVGGAAQASMMKKIVGPLKLEMSQYDEIARFAKFGTDVNETTQRQLKRGERLQALFSQGPHHPVSMARQVIGYYALVNDFLDEVDPGEVPTFVEALLNRIALSERQILDELEDSGTLSDKTEDELQEVLEAFCREWEMEKGAAS